MKPVVYIDVLFIVNFFINFLLLWATGYISKLKVSIIRLIIGAAIGAVYAVIIFFPAFRIYYTIIAKFIFSMLLVAVTYNIAKIKKFFAVLGVFYFVSFTFGGAALGLFYFTNIGTFLGAFLSNGIIYINLPWKILMFSGIIAYIIIRVTWRLIKIKIDRDNLYIPLTIVFDSKSIQINALLDTGNALHDPLSNMPVIIVEFQAIKDLLPQEIQKLFYEYCEDNLTIIANIMSNSTWISRFRLIPFSSLGKENGMLIGFKPDQIEILSEPERKGLHDIIIGIYNKKLSKNEEYEALLHPELIV